MGGVVGSGTCVDGACAGDASVPGSTGEGLAKMVEEVVGAAGWEDDEPTSAAGAVHATATRTIEMSKLNRFMGYTVPLGSV
ncbi:MAG: hypothetical protein M5U23_05680 [Acidimicrobiia bacterium]|nr:hypothetical protein [Acidimicrobiia bacterium]